jgi:hypothetical protein
MVIKNLQWELKEAETWTLWVPQYGHWNLADMQSPDTVLSALPYKQFLWL